MEKKTITLIHASTGCSCCANENHMRGPYRTLEDAERRIQSYYTGDYWPLASQYARRGRYSAQEHNADVLPDGRILDNDEDRIITSPFIEVDEQGNITTDPDDEWLWSD